MRFVGKFLVCLCIIAIADSQSEDNSDNLNKVINDGLNEVYSKTNYVTQRLQENVVKFINEGREKLFILKGNVQKIIEKEDEVFEKCRKYFEEEFRIFVKNVQVDLKSCAGESFQSSEQYRRKVKDEITEVQSGIELRRKYNKCFATKNIENSECTYHEVNENNRVSEELKDIFKEISETSQEYAVEVLSQLMECNKNVLKNAKEMQNELRRTLMDCIEENKSINSQK